MINWPPARSGACSPKRAKLAWLRADRIDALMDKFLRTSGLFNAARAQLDKWLELWLASFNPTNSVGKRSSSLIAAAGVMPRRACRGR
jgi:hypothetical protein